MTPVDAGMMITERCHGVRQVVRFNWPHYAFAASAILIGVAAASNLTLPAWAQTACWLAIAPPVWWIAASLVASWTVYDRSPLMRCEWIRDALPVWPLHWIHIHAGLDELTPALRAVLTGLDGRAIDIFDPATMTAPSIARARRLARAGDTAASKVRDLPVCTGSVDAAFVLLSAHELRTHAERVALFGELRRVITPFGCVIVAEHLRDAANFIAYGPGFLHFHSRRTWLRGFTSAGFRVRREWAITPFVRVFVLRRAS